MALVRDFEMMRSEPAAIFLAVVLAIVKRPPGGWCVHPVRRAPPHPGKCPPKARGAFPDANLARCQNHVNTKTRSAGEKWWFGGRPRNRHPRAATVHACAGSPEWCSMIR